MKTKSAMLIIFMVASTIMFAQRRESRNPEARADRLNEYMKKELSLTDNQYEKVKAINEAFGDRFRKLRKDSTISKEASRDEIKKIRDEHAAALKGVLTDKQYAQWTALENSHKERFAGNRADYMKKELSLSDEQYSKVNAINKNFGERLKTLRNDSTMSRETARAEFRKIRDEKNVALKGVLTPDQYNKWISMKAKRSHDRKRREGLPANRNDKKG